MWLAIWLFKCKGMESLDSPRDKNLPLISEFSSNPPALMHEFLSFPWCSKTPINMRQALASILPYDKWKEKLTSSSCTHPLYSSSFLFSASPSNSPSLLQQRNWARESFPLTCLSFKSSNTFPLDSNRKSSPSLLFLLGQYPENRKKTRNFDWP